MQLFGRIKLISLCSMPKFWIIESGARFKYWERTMTYPTAYTSTVAIPLPSKQAVQQIMGKSYDPERTLNVPKMVAGTEDLFEATIGIVEAMFEAKGIDPRTREMIILRAAKELNVPYGRKPTCRWLIMRAVFRGDRRCRHGRAGIWN